MNLGGVSSGYNESCHTGRSTYGSVSIGTRSSEALSNVALVHSDNDDDRRIQIPLQKQDSIPQTGIAGLKPGDTKGPVPSLKQHYREVREIRKGGRKRTTLSKEDTGGKGQSEDTISGTDSKILEKKQERDRLREERKVDRSALKRNVSDVGRHFKREYTAPADFDKEIVQYKSTSERPMAKTHTEEYSRRSNSAPALVSIKTFTRDTAKVVDPLTIRSRSAHGKSGNVHSTLTLEVDFYHNPTILSRLILNEKYKAAMRRLYENPRETSVWVCAKRLTTNAPESATGSTNLAHQQQSIYSMRQLPIHIACRNLRKTHDSTMKRLLNNIIANLIFSNPDGSNAMDHHGRYPIHDAIWHGATAETVAMFLIAKPSSVHLKDYKDRSLIEVNKHSPRSLRSKKEIQRVLELDEYFWKNARQEAAFRLNHSSVKWPTDMASVGSLSVLAPSSQAFNDEDEGLGVGDAKHTNRHHDYHNDGESKIPDNSSISSYELNTDDDDESFCGDETSNVRTDMALAESPSDSATEDVPALRQEEMAHSKRIEQQQPQFDQQEVVHATQASNITPISWEQLEARALSSEQILMEMNEQYYNMSKTVEALKVLGEQQYKELLTDLSQLSRENNSLNDKLRRLQDIFVKISTSGAEAISDELRRVCMSLVDTAQSLTDVASTDSTYNSVDIVANESKIREMVKAMSSNQILQNEHIRKLAYFIGNTVLNVGSVTKSLKTKSSHSIESNTFMSALTSRSAKSTWSPESSSKQKRQEMIVDYIPVDTMTAENNDIDEENNDDEEDEDIDNDENIDVQIVDNLDDVFRYAASATTTELQLSPQGIVVKQKVQMNPKMMMTQKTEGVSNETILPRMHDHHDVKKQQTKNIGTVVVTNATTTHDYTVPALFADDYKFETISVVSNVERRIFG